MPLPEQPNLEQLRKQARELQRAVRAGLPHAVSVTSAETGAPDYQLNNAQLDLARHYGFASWPRLRRHVEALSARSWVYAEPAAEESATDRFLRLACLNYAHDSTVRRSQAVEWLARHPGLAAESVAVAAVCADVEAVAGFRSRDPDSARRPTGVFGWSPLMYLAYARFDADRDAVLNTARLLLDAGADPDDGRFFHGRPTPFTVLSGVFGGGEGRQPAHRDAVPLARLLLSRGADANDGQTLYNRMFTEDDDFLEVLLEFGLGQGSGGPWREMLPDLLKPPAALVRDLLQWAVLHDQRARVGLLADHGVDVVSPLASGRTPLDVAAANGHRELVAQLSSLGAQASSLDPVETFIAAALAGDAAKVRAAPLDVVKAARRTRPGLLVWAAGQERPEAVELLVAAGFDVNAFGRSDLPLEQKWHTALHAAVEGGNTQLVRRLIELGAAKDLRDARFDGTPLDWAEHLGQTALVPLLRA